MPLSSMQRSAGARRHHNDHTINCPPHSWHLLTIQRRSRDTLLPYPSHVTNGAAGSPSHAHVWRLSAPLSAPMIGCGQRGTVESGRAVWPLPRRFGAKSPRWQLSKQKRRAGPGRPDALRHKRPGRRSASVCSLVECAQQRALGAETCPSAMAQEFGEPAIPAPNLSI
jgi:hypothetical protein